MSSVGLLQTAFIVLGFVTEVQVACREECFWNGLYFMELDIKLLFAHWVCISARFIADVRDASIEVKTVTSVMFCINYLIFQLHRRTFSPSAAVVLVCLLVAYKRKRLYNFLLFLFYGVAACKLLRAMWLLSASGYCPSLRQNNAQVRWTLFPATIFTHFRENQQLEEDTIKYGIKCR